MAEGFARDSHATQIDFPDVRLELDEIKSNEAKFEIHEASVEEEKYQQPSVIRNDTDLTAPISSVRKSKEAASAVQPPPVVLQTSSDVFKLVQIQEPVKAKKPPLKLPTIKMKKQLSPTRGAVK